MARHPTLLGFLIALTVISFFAGGFALFLGSGAEHYAGEYDNSTLRLQKYQKINELEEMSSQSAKKSTDVSGGETKIGEQQDVVGTLFSGGYKVFVSMTSSVSMMSDMINSAISQAGLLSAFGGLLSRTLITIILFTIILGVIVAALIKRNII